MLSMGLYICSIYSNVYLGVEMLDLSIRVSICSRCVRENVLFEGNFGMCFHVLSVYVIGKVLLYRREKHDKKNKL